ncbi:MAG: cytidine deaminase [Firmicutes bacterium]|nr:cytidine deaminase [Bacillota bacterium]MDD7228389.1 cytidine deaminase [Bacillota bacterium]MDY4973605.1 cytidine deaminase [Erysipelotrichaceae bacterium]MDY5997105.1 cytidine deaminase [Erysipelotrichaceae bacterium]
MYQDVLNEAFEAMKDAYAPYSNYHVGACVKCKDGRMFRGVNIENASYGATNCGERSAIFGAYSYGYRKDDIEVLAIVTDGGRIGAPCGICRQVLSELLNEDTPIVLSNGIDVQITNIKELLPFSFSKDDLVK